MKTILLLVCMTAGMFAFSQNPDNKVFLFGTESISLKESDHGDYKKYDISKKAKIDDKDTVIVLSTFIVYNDETPEFKGRFISTFKELKEDEKLDSDLNDDAFEKEAEIAYLRIRSMEVNKALKSESNFEPKAGTLLVATDVDVQKVDKSMKREVKGIMKEKMKSLRKDDTFSIKPYLINDKWLLVEISDNKSDNKNGKYKYKEEFFSTDKKGEKEGAPTSTKYYKNKRRVKFRLVELIADSIKSIQEYKLNELGYKSDSLTTKNNSHREKAKQNADSISKLDNEIKELENRLVTLDSNEKLAEQLESELENYKINVLENLTKIPAYETIRKDFEGINFTDNNNDNIFSLLTSVNNHGSQNIDSIWKLDIEIGKKKIEIDSLKYLIAKESVVNNEVNFKLLNLQSDSALFEGKKVRFEQNNVALQEITEALKNIISLKIKVKDKEDLTNEKITLNALKESLKTRRDLASKQAPILNDSISRNEDQNLQLKRRIEEIYLNLLHDSLKIDSVQIEFNDGSIENIQVIGRLKSSNNVLKFSNVGPIGFTGKMEIEALNNRWLFATFGNDIIYSINAGQVIKDYYEKYEVERRDYSPRNQTFTISRKSIAPQLQNSGVQNCSPEKSTNDSIFIKDVYKEYSSDILTGTIFTDLNGLSGDEPNGIIQTEFYKEMAIFKQRFNFERPMFKTKTINLNVKPKSDFSFGFASYVKPHFVISKIESENKILELGYKNLTINNQTDSIFYASTIDLRKHESFRVGLGFNLLFFDLPSAKTSIFLDYSFYGARIPVIKPATESQPAPQKFNSNAIEHGAFVTTEFFTDERYGLRISGGFNAYHVYNDKFIQVGDNRDFSNNTEMEDKSKYRSTYWKAEFLAYLKPNSDGKGKIFFRYSYYMPHDHADLSWSQIQLGYAFSVTKTEIPAGLK